MAITSWPYTAQPTSDVEYGRLYREMAPSDGMVGSLGDTVFQVYADSSGMNVKVRAGSAILRGYMVYSTAVETLTIAASTSSVRLDRIVLELNLSAPTIAQRIIPKVVQGTPGSGTAPALVQVDTGVWQISLAVITVGANATNIAASAVADDRGWIHQTVGQWKDASGRPKSPRKYKLGFNEQLGYYEYYNGSAWVRLVSSDLAGATTTGVLPVSKGGTGATSVGAAQTALQVYSKADVDAFLATRATTAALTTGLNGKANTSHTHSAADITSGALAIARGGTGATSATAALQALGIYVQSSQPAYAANRVWIRVP